MSLLIRGANMPKNCAVCPLERDVFGRAVCCGKADGDRIATPIYEADLPSTDFEERRPSWCPLIEVHAPHGDLVDIDKALNHLPANYNKEDLEDAVATAPTVIEAEKGE